MRKLEERASAARKIKDSDIWPLVVAEIGDMISSYMEAESVEQSALSYSAIRALSTLKSNVEHTHIEMMQGMSQPLEISDFK